jgi:thiol-disulfide isomerase/thioredoxin
MKFTLGFIMLLVCGPVFGQYTLKTDSVYISGKVSHFEKHKDSANSVNIIVDDIAFGQQLTYRSKINNNGTYKLSFLKTGPQDIMLLYNDDVAGVIVKPGNHMQIDFDADSFTKSLVFNGDDAQTNKDMIAYNAAVEKQKLIWYGEDGYGRFRILLASQKEAQPDDHKKFLTDRYAKETLYLEQYIKQHKLSPIFVTWARADLKYEYLEYLMRYTWMHPMYNKIKAEDFKLPDSYYDFVEAGDLNNSSMAISTHFGNYLREYKNYFVIKTLGTSWRTGADFELYFKQPAGITKDIMLCNTFYSSITAKHLDLLRPYMGKFKANVINPAFKKAIVDEFNRAENQSKNYTLPASAHIKQTPKTEADSLFSKIIAQYPNKVVYVDFWATWCGPCRAEMPNSKVLRNQFANKDVVFLYLGVQSEEKTWKAMIAELDIKGEHLLLNKNEFSAISEKFQISGIPRYLLLDKNGRVVDDNAKRPGDQGLKSDIEKLLARK